MTYSPLTESAIYLSAIFSPELVILACWFLATLVIAIAILRKVRFKDVFKGAAPSVVKASVLIVGSTTLATILSQVFKNLFKIARPAEMLIAETGFSFPSGHASLTTAFFTALVVSMYAFYPKTPMPLRRLITWISLLLIIGVSASRLVLHVHRIEDVACGIVIGLISTLFVQSFFKKDIDVEYKHGNNNSHKSH